MSLTPYRRVLALPAVARLMLFAILGRVPQTAAGVVLTLHVVTRLRLGYAAAALVITSMTAGTAVGSPWLGRAIDRLGLRRALLPSAVLGTASWLAAPLLGYSALLVAAFLGGVIMLPVFTVVRQSLSVLVPADQRRTAYALDSVGVELSYLVGPTAGVLLVTQLSSTAALLALGACQAVAGTVLLVMNPPTRSAAGAGSGTAPVAPGPASTPRPVPVRSVPVRVDGALRGWVTPALVAVLAAGAAATMVLSGTEVALIAGLRAGGALSLTWLVFLAWTGGSMAGGLVYGAARRPLSPFALLLGMALLTVPVGLTGVPALLALTILPAAVLCAPVLSATAESVSRLVPEQVRGEALGWHGSALTAGISLGGPLAGAAIDAQSPWAGFVVVGGLGCVLALAGLGLQRRGRVPAAVRVA